MQFFCFEYSPFKKRQYRRMKKQETGSVMLIKKIQNIWNNFKQSLFERVFRTVKNNVCENDSVSLYRIGP